MNAEAPLIELLAHAALKGVAVLGIALLLGLLLSRAAAARRYAVWLTAVVMLGILPLALLVLPAWRVLPQAPLAPPPPVEQPVPEVPMAEAVPSVPTVESAPAQVVAPAPAALPPVVFPAETSPPPFRLTWDAVIALLPGLWLAITGLLLLRLAWGARCLHRLEKTLTPGASDLLHETAREMGLRRAPRLLIGAENAVPMVWGVWRPRLLLPRGFETWSREKLRGVLLHELAHLKRRDPLALWAAQWVKALHWFNPLAWLTLRQLRADQERACDDTVLRHGMRPSDYAQHLLDLSRHARLAPGLALCALTITRCAPVESRVKAILDPKRPRDGLTLRWLAGLAGLALLTTLPVAMLHAIEGSKLRGRILDRNGVVLAESTPEKARHYPLKALAARVTGYASKAAPEDTTFTGRGAIEKRHDAALNKGQDITLTLDARVQSVATGALSESVRRGGMVIMDPETGGILAYVSLPTYDANRFIPTVSSADWEAYSQDKDGPLTDRAGSILSAPGAVFQPVAALAAFLAGKTPGTHTCSQLTNAPGGGVRFGSATKACRTSQLAGVPHGPLTLEQALAQGCFAYFYQLGADTGYPDLFSMAGQLGVQMHFSLFGDKLTQVMSSPEEATKIHSSQRQMLDFTTDMASGRGRPFTVVQMAALYSALVNGKVWEPSLTQSSAGRLRQNLNTLPGLPEGLTRVRSAMRDTVSQPQPWARSLAGSKAQIAALGDGYATGTKGPRSEVFTHHYWMAGYAPADKPSLAFALYVDETSSGSEVVPDKLGPVVRRIIEETLALPADGSGEAKAAEETADGPSEKLRLVQLAGQKSEIAAAVGQAEKEIGAGLVIKTLSIEDGSVTLQGEAASLDQAVQLRDKLAKLGKNWNLTWQFPLPQAVAGGDGQRVSFRAVGTVQAGVKTREEEFKEKLKRASSKATTSSKMYEELSALRTKIKALEAESPPNQAAVAKLKKSEQTLAAQWHASGAPVQTVRASQMSPADVKKWQTVQKHGALAELPQEAIAHVATAEDLESFVGQQITYFWFSAPREEVHRWLTTSMSEKTKKMHAKTPPWPDAPEPFLRYYSMGGDCTITLHSLDGKTVVVKVMKYKRSIMIAPDEATPPRPKTAAPRELDGVVEVEDAKPDLNAQLFWLLPPPTVESETGLPAFPGYLPNPVSVQWPPAKMRPELLRDPVPKKLPMFHLSPARDDLLKAAMAPRGQPGNFSKALLVSAPE